MGGVLRRIAQIERLVPRDGSKVLGRVRGWVSKLTLECGHSVYRPRCKEPKTHARCEECKIDMDWWSSPSCEQLIERREGWLNIPRKKLR